MAGHEVLRLEHATPQVAEAIRAVMFAAYQVEAALLGVADFVPLRRTAAHIATTDALFLGVSMAGELAGVTEIETPEPDHLHIGSLVVLPAHFRRGLATTLLRHVSDHHPAATVTVSTGIANRPAITLYERFGFREDRRWATADGIAMVTLRRSPGAMTP